MKKFLFLSILCYACNVVYGQHYIPVKKMISNYKEQKAIDTLKNHDIIYNPLAELSQCILDSSNGSIINVI